MTRCRQDVYNQITTIQYDSLEGQSTLHALAEQLNKQGFQSQVQFAPNSHVTVVFFAHLDSLSYLQAYSDLP